MHFHQMSIDPRSSTYESHNKIVLNTISNFNHGHANSISDNKKHFDIFNYTVVKNKQKEGFNSWIQKEQSINFESESLTFSNHSQKSSQQLPLILNNKESIHKNFLIMSPDLKTAYHWPRRKISNGIEIKDKSKFKTLISTRKINAKKYSNFPNQSKFSNSVTNNGIDENIPTTSFLELSIQQSKNILKHSKTNPNSISSSYGNSDSKFKTKSNIIEIDNFLHKTIKGKNFSWIAGEIISEGFNSIVYKACNQDEGKLFVVKKYNCPPNKKCDNFIVSFIYKSIHRLK